MDDIPKIGITGMPSVGKTDTLLKIIKSLEEHGYTVEGMITEPIIEHKKRVGFYVTDWKTREKEVFAHIDYELKEKIGKYGVDVNALEKIDETFDDLWTFHGKFRKTVQKSEEQKEKEKKLDIIKFRIIENKTCPKCQKKMDKMKSHYECQHCGEIVILEGYNQPIFNIAASDLEIDFAGDFPLNFYMPVSGITVKWLMGEWKALVVIYSKDNPNKKWLRFYWWSRDLQNIMKYGQREMGEGTQMGWKAQRGVASPNLYEKKHLKPLINALRNVAREMNWDIDN